MTESETMKVDQRLIGKTAENIFLSILNQRGIFATAFDTESLDGIVFDAYSHGFWPANRIKMASESHSFWPPRRI